MAPLLLVVLAASTVTFDREAALKKFLAEPCEQSDVWRGMWEGMKERSPCVILHAAKPEPQTFEQAQSELAKAWAIPPAAALPLLEAELFSRTDTRHYNDKEARAWVTSKFEEALAAAPGSPAVVHAIAAGQGDGATLDQLERSLKAFTHPASVAKTLLRTYPSVEALGAVVALKDDPSSLPAVAEALVDEGDYPTNVGLRVLQLGLATPVSFNALGPLARALLEEALEKHLPELAFDLWDGFPAPVREFVLTPPALVQTRRREHQDLALEMAVAALEIGREPDAALFAPRVPEPEWPKATKRRRHDDNCNQAVLRETLLRARDPKRSAKDSFTLGRALQTCYYRRGFERVFADLLRAKQPALAQRLQSRLRHVFDDYRDDDLLPVVKEFAAPADELIAAAKERRAKAISAYLARVEPPASSPTFDLLSRLLDVPAWSPWKEKPLPTGVTPAPTGPGYSRFEEKLALPKGYWAIRVERKKKELWVVAASQNADPTGEATSGGYWLLHSRSDGVEWDPPIYTGLRVMQPYVVTENSTMPLFQGGRITLEVQVKELNLDSLRFPPIGAAILRKASGLYLEATLAELRRDSDRDRLSDLLETRLLSDPRSADSDKDGLNDGEDSFPTVPFPKEEPHPNTDLLTAILAEVLREEKPAGNVVGTGASEFEKAAGRRAPIARDRAVFIVGNRQDFIGVRSSSLVIVLTEQEVERISRERGLLYPLEIEFVIDEAGENAQINWSERWRGGSYDAHKEDGRWVLESTGFWIT